MGKPGNEANVGLHHVSVPPERWRSMQKYSPINGVIPITTAKETGQDGGGGGGALYPLSTFGRHCYIYLRA